MSLSVSEPRPAEASAYPRLFGDRYVLLEELGHGGMGTVCCAVTGQPGVERVCALKVIRDVSTADGADRDGDLGTRFLDEAKVVTKLTHENLVYVFDYGVVGGQGYLAMEFVEGRTLTETWNRCAHEGVGFPFGVSLFLASELVAGLAYAHAAPGLHLIHRDVSPSNIMLSFTGGVKLIDFGLAKWKAKVAQTATGVNWGKVSYMSPEQYLGKTIDHRSDLYSAMVILWELLTGRQMFPAGETRPHEPEPLPPSSCNGQSFPELDAVMLKALQPDPDRRYQTGAELAAALTALLPRDATKLQLGAFVSGLFQAERAGSHAHREALLGKARALWATERKRAASAGTAVAQEARAEGPKDPLIGVTLDERYFIRRLIGQGAMGRVYEGHHTGIGKRVAIKIPRRPERRRAELLARFRLEATAASQIGHPGIADVTDCGTTPSGDFYFVMEYVDGIDLERLVGREGALAFERALTIALQVARALEAAHQAGIIHRDLKPSNVMVVRRRDDAEATKVLDFGVAKFLRGDALPDGEVLASLTRTHAAVGTPRYMAPEQIETGKHVDFRADIYALGGLLYFMLSGGRAPIEGESVQNVWRRKLHEEAAPLARPDLPPDVEALVMRCLARDPNARPQTMKEVRASLVALLDGTQTPVGGGKVLALPQTRAGAAPASLVVPTVAPYPESSTAVAPLRGLGRNTITLVGIGLGALTAAGALALWRSGGPETVATRPAPTASPPVATTPPAAPPPPSTAAPLAPPPPVPAAPPPLAVATAPVAPTPPVAAATRATASPPVAATAPAAPPASKATVTAPPQPSVAKGPVPISPAPAPSGPPAALPVAAKASGTPERATGPARTETPPAPPGKEISADPALARSLLDDAEQAFQEGNHDAAIAAARKAERAGAVLDALIFLGKVFRNTDRLDEAMAAYQRALTIDPANAAAKRGLDLAQKTRGR